MTPTPGTRTAPPRPADLAAPTVSMAAAPTPALLPPLLDEPSTPMGGRPAPAAPLAYALLQPSKSGAVFLQRGRSVVLPLFTGWDQAAAFLVAARMTRCWILELPTEDAVADFLRCPPGRAGVVATLLVAVDPADIVIQAADLFPARAVIDVLRGDRR